MDNDCISPNASQSVIVEEIIQKRATDAEVLRREAPHLFAGFDSLMKEFYQPFIGKNDYWGNNARVLFWKSERGFALWLNAISPAGRISGASAGIPSIE